MYQFMLFILYTFFHIINCEVRPTHQIISQKFNDLFKECSQNGGAKLCLGIMPEGYKYSNLDCVNLKNCAILFQFELTEPDSGLDAGKHCLYLSKDYKDQIQKETKSESETALIGVRFGTEPGTTDIESSCFLGQPHPDIFQLYYPEKKRGLHRIKKAPAFNPILITEDSAGDSGLFYCCIEQPLRIKVNNETEFYSKSEENEVNLDKRVFPSLFYRIGTRSNSLKTNDPYNLLDYKKKIVTSPPTTRYPFYFTTTTTTTAPSSIYTTTKTTTTTSTETNINNGSLSPQSTTLSPTEPETELPSVELEPVKEDQKPSDSSSSNSGKAFIIFGIFIVLLVIFLLISLSIYNLLIK